MLRQRRGKLGELAYLAKAEDKSAKITFRGDQVLVDDIPIQDELIPPIAEEILMRSNEQELSMESVYFYKSKVKTILGSKFQIHAAKINDMREANNTYKAIHRYRNAAAATHLISAHRLQNGQVGWRDDGDHAMGRHLYSAMKNKKITNMVFFLSRNYGGQHIGKRRFDVTTELVDEIMQVIKQEDRAATEKAKRRNDDDYDESEKEPEQPVVSTLDDLAWDSNAAIARARYTNADRFQSDFYFDNNLVDSRYAQDDINEVTNTSGDKSENETSDIENEAEMTTPDTIEEESAQKSTGENE